jgi:hypothetical protein
MGFGINAGRLLCVALYFDGGFMMYSLTDAARIYGKDSSHFRNVVKKAGVRLELTHKSKLPQKRGMPVFVLTISREDLHKLIEKRDGHSL